MFGKEIPFEGHPVFEVNTYVLDREGGHVTFYQGGFGTFYMLGGGTIVPVKFPYPHPMFEIVGEVETAQIRAGWTAHYVMEREKRRSRRWNRIIDSILQPKWLTKKLDALLA